MERHLENTDVRPGRAGGALPGAALRILERGTQCHGCERHALDIHELAAILGGADSVGYADFHVLRYVGTDPGFGERAPEEDVPGATSFSA